MSYQVNFRLLVPDCAYWEAEAIAQLQGELQEAFARIVTQHHIVGKEVCLHGAEITYLTK